MTALGDRFVVEKHGRKWEVVDLGADHRTRGPLHDTHDAARQHASRLNTARQPKPRATAHQGTLLDPQEAE